MLDVVKKTWASQALRSGDTGAALGIGRTFMNHLVLCLTASGVVTIAPAALSQSAAPAGSANAPQQTLCMSDPQGLMCHPVNHSSKTVIASSTAIAPTSPPASPQLLNAAQMEQISNMLLGLLYFVLPAGFGLGLFLHDRYQSQRAALLEAQIQLLEKLWEQSPQG